MPFGPTWCAAPAARAAARRPSARSPRRRAGRQPLCRFALPGSRSERRCSWRRLSFHYLLQSPRCVMVMHTRGSGCRRQCRRDLFVFQSLLRPEQEHFPLQARQLLQSCRELRHDLARLRMLMRVAAHIADGLVERQHFAPRRPASEIPQHVAGDRQQPGAKLTLPAKAIHAAKRPNERLLHQVIQLGLGRTGTGQIARQRPGVAPDELGRRLFVAPLPRPNQRGVGRGGCWNHVRLGHRAPVYGRHTVLDIKGYRLLGTGYRVNAPPTADTWYPIPPPGSTCPDRDPWLGCDSNDRSKTCDHTTSVSTTCSPAPPGSLRTRATTPPPCGTSRPRAGCLSPGCTTTSAARKTSSR